MPSTYLLVRPFDGNPPSSSTLSVPSRLFTMYDGENQPSAVSLDFNQPCKDELWWNSKPLTNLDLSSNVITELPGKIGMFQDLLTLNVRLDQPRKAPRLLNFSYSCRTTV